MSFLDQFVIRAGSALAGPLYSAWRRRFGKTEQNARSLSDLLSLDNENKLAAHRIEREINSLSEYITETMLPVFASDGTEISQSQQEAITIAISNTFSDGGISPSIFFQNELNPDILFKYYNDLSQKYRTGLSIQETAFLDACIKEICLRLLDVSENLPVMNATFQREVIQRQLAIYDVGKKTLDSIKEFTERNRYQRTLIVNNFHNNYRRFVRRAFGDIHVFGLDIEGVSTKLPLEISYLSLRASSGKPKKVEDIDDNGAEKPRFPAEEVLTNTRRALILGPAGSGKTTLLQWLCTKIVDRSLTGSLSKLNSYTPFFVRLRDFNDREMPVGNELIASLSRTLASSIPEDWVQDIISSGRAIFLVDGLDETISTRYEKFQIWLDELVELSPQSYFVVTSRPASLDMSLFSALSFKEHTLQRMNPGEVRSFIEYWHAGLQENCRSNDMAVDFPKKIREVNSIISESSSLSRLASGPLLCAIICTLNFKSRLSLATSRVDLYRTSVRLLIHERDSLRGVLDPIYTALSYDEKERFLSEIAYWLVRNSKVTIAKQEFIETLQNLITEQQIDRWIQNPAIAKNLGRPASNLDVINLKNNIISPMLANSLLVRSGLLQEVGYNEIQFIHKTFQEYLASISVKWHGDEELLARNLDIRRWNELVLLVVSTTALKRAESMLSLLVNRGKESVKKSEANYCYLLAASCLRETYNLSDETKKNVISYLANLLPPENRSSVSFLAGAGDLVVPLLTYNDGLTKPQISHSIEALTYVNTRESRKSILNYCRLAEISDSLIDAIIDSTIYIEDTDFISDVVNVLVERNDSMIMHKNGDSNRLRVANTGITTWAKFLSSFNEVILNGFQSEIIFRMSDTDLFNDNDIRKITVVNGRGKIQTNFLLNQGYLEEINFINTPNLTDLDFLSSVGVKVIRFYKVEDIIDVDGLMYSDSVKSVYLENVGLDTAIDIVKKLKGKKCDIFIGDKNTKEMRDKGVIIKNSGTVNIWSEDKIREMVEEVCSTM